MSKWNHIWSKNRKAIHPLRSQELEESLEETRWCNTSVYMAPSRYFWKSVALYSSAVTFLGFSTWNYVVFVTFSVKYRCVQKLQLIAFAVSSHCTGHVNFFLRNTLAQKQKGLSINNQATQYCCCKTLSLSEHLEISTGTIETFRRMMLHVQVPHFLFLMSGNVWPSWQTELLMLCERQTIALLVNFQNDY